MSGYYTPRDNEVFNVEVAPRQNINIMGEDGVKLLEDLQNQPEGEMTFEPDDSRDYFINNADGTVIRVAGVVTINGVRWYLKIGTHKYPRDIIDFVKQCPEQSKRISNRFSNNIEPNKSKNMFKVDPQPHPASYANIKAAEQMKYSI